MMINIQEYRSLRENIMLYFVNVYVLCIYYTYTSRKHLRIEVSPDLHLNYSQKRGKSGVGIKMIKMDYFLYFSTKSYVVDVH